MRRAVLLLVCVLILIVFTTCESKQIIKVKGDNQKIRASSNGDEIQIRVQEADKPLKGADVYFYPDIKSKTRVTCVPSHVKTDKDGLATCKPRAGFVPGTTSLIVSFQKNDPRSKAELKFSFTTTPPSIAYGWIQIAILSLLTLVGFVIAIIMYTLVMRHPEGPPSMRDIAKVIAEGANGYLRTQYITIAAISIPISILLFIIFVFKQKSSADPDVSTFVTALITSLSFLLGCFCSACAGFVAMKTSVRANVRVAFAATHSYSRAMDVGTQAGTFVSYFVISVCVCGLMGIYILMHIWSSASPEHVGPHQIAILLTGFTLGASFSALFQVVGGGVFTKAADVGADLVGKVEQGIPEDDPRNPAVIADLVGDNVGDCAGRGADLFESIAAENVGTMILAGALAYQASPQISTVTSYVLYPIAINVFGMISSIIGVLFVRVRNPTRDRMTESLLGGQQREVFETTDVGSTSEEVVESEPVDENNEHIGSVSQDEDAISHTQTLRSEDLEDPMGAVNRGFAISVLVAIILTSGASFWFLYNPLYPRAWYHFAVCTIIGILSSWLFVFFAIYYTDANYRPVKEISVASRSGAATNIISGLAVGMESTGLPVLTIAIAIALAYALGNASGVIDASGISIGGVFGIAAATQGMLCCCNFILAFDCMGPICDNSGGIVEMSGQHENVRVIADKLDALGNTTKALTKTYSLGSAAFSAFVIFSAFMDNVSGTAGIEFKTINIATPPIFIAALLGGLIIFIFTSMTMRSVSTASQSVIVEVRKQFRERPGIMERKEKPDYKRCVSVVTQAALREMILPTLLVVTVPIALGLIYRVAGYYSNSRMLGAEASAAFLISATIVAVLMALLLNTGGGAFDNCKKLVEARMSDSIGVAEGKGSEQHKAAVVGDTVGDPMKDTSGPALHTAIKLLATIALLFGPLFVNRE